MKVNFYIETKSFELLPSINLQECFGLYFLYIAWLWFVIEFAPSEDDGDEEDLEWASDMLKPNDRKEDDFDATERDDDDDGENDENDGENDENDGDDD